LILLKRHSLESLNKTFSTFKEQKVKFEELTLANNLIKEADSRIEKLKPKKARATSALKVLNKIILEDSEEKVLVDFFQKNENEISEIFTSIHAPKEFSRLSFSSNKIVLYKKDLEQEVPISQISTGQRSALALSIFLALNKKLAKGPNLIIFDDPVTYTDDLNILSFLDYLRSMVINESRQLIFATASNKIARLFEKKFDFLKSDFQKFELSRSIT
jgi:DNA repair protein SbcC/Rad50